MSTVFLAHDLRRDRPVALKVLREDLTSIVGVKRFEREVQTVARFAHPQIVPLYDSGEAAGRLFYTMPFVEGASLRDRIAAGPLAVGEAITVALDIGRALDYAHRRGVIHRDVKPDNVLLVDGRALVTDFGLARALASAQDKLTQTGHVVGTPAYMSPEQVAGLSTLDERVDQYALACTVFEALTGRTPFEAASIPEMMALHATAPPPLAHELRPEVPARLSRVIVRALAKERGQRFPGMGAFLDALEQSPSRSGLWGWFRSLG
jgi:serine/threonine-protein kinase